MLSIADAPCPIDPAAESWLKGRMRVDLFDFDLPEESIAPGPRCRGTAPA